MKVTIDPTIRANIVDPRLGGTAIEDLVQVYSLQAFAAPLGLQLDDASSTLLVEYQPHDDVVTWKIEIALREGGTATQRNQPIWRDYGRAHPFRGRPGTGRILFHQLFCLQPEYCDRGLGGEVLKRELALYRRWGVQEVQLTQGCEANKRLTWMKKGFRMTDEMFGVVAANFDAVFCKQHKELGGMALSPRIDEWPEQFLKEFGTLYPGLHLFMDLS